MSSDSLQEPESSDSLNDSLQELESPDSLQKLVEAALVESLGDLGANNSNFCCGGNLEVPQQAIDIIYLHQSQDVKNEELLSGSHELSPPKKKARLSCGYHRVSLPGASDTAFSDFIYASCCRGNGTYQLDKDSFFTSFQLCSTNILSEIEAMLARQSNRIRAEVDKLNIYTAGGSYLETCVGTPQCKEEMKFGKLIVCLPTQFTGGTLVTRSLGNEVMFKWSDSSPQVQSTILRWAAFFDGTEHELLPVTSGYCVTLTYHLFLAKERSVPTNSFIQLLGQLVTHPHFMRRGGRLGFQCQHKYQYIRLNEKELVPFLLKGSDYIVFSAAKSLGLYVRISPLVRGYKHWYLMGEFSDGCDNYDPRIDECDDIDVIAPPMDLEMQTLGALPLSPGDPKPGESNYRNRYRPKRCEPVTWCTGIKLNEIAGYYKDYRAECTLHQAAVIVVDVPCWSDRESAGKVGAMNRGEHNLEAEFWLHESYEPSDEEFRWGG